MPSLRFRALAALTLAASMLVISSPAFAEAGRAPPRCGVSIAPSNTLTVPSNLPAIVASPASFAEGAQRVIVTAFDAIDGAGDGMTLADEVEKRADPRVRGATLFVPNGPFAEGTTFEAAFDVDCDGLDTKTVTRFTTTLPSPLPSTIGTLTTRAGESANAAELLVDPTPELRAFLPVTMFELETRAGVVVAAEYGRASLAEGERIRVVTPSTLATALCPPDTETTLLETMSLRAHVAGAETDPPPIAFEISIACQRFPIAAPTTPSTTNEPPSDAGGCATSPESKSSVWISLGLGALFVVASRVRRSSR